MSWMLKLLTLIILAQPGMMAKGEASHPARPECPIITVEASDDLVCPYGDVTFTAGVAGGDPSIQQTFNWTVSAGTIIAGQGTRTITVSTANATVSPTGEPQSITATITIGGFTALTVSCPQTSSHTVGIASCCIFHRKFDEFGDIALNDEKARLKNFVIQLQNEPGTLGYIVIYAGKRAHLNEAQGRLERAKNYLVNEGGLDAQRIQTIDGGYREELTVELWVAPSGAPPLVPDTSGNMDPAEVEIIPDPSEHAGRNH
jgi:hypothetical protein